ncbi:MAG: hypothetical protein K2X93_21935 [Candidatus Obscuribacterales bacterium]|nr:hypothetical protein [Candidatus Obscuribacterales bacterium]
MTEASNKDETFDAIKTSDLQHLSRQEQKRSMPLDKSRQPVEHGRSSAQVDSCASDNGSESSPREELAILQGQFLNALLGLSPSPQQLDGEQVETCGRSLRGKRARTIERMGKPSPAETGCACTITEEMTEYFRQYPGAHPEGPLADFQRYKRFLLLRPIKKFFCGIKLKYD